MVSIKFWRGKFSRPATGYECIAHAPAFDRGVRATTVLKFSIDRTIMLNLKVKYTKQSICD